jgi:hypothetical protein
MFRPYLRAGLSHFGANKQGNVSMQKNVPNFPRGTEAEKPSFYTNRATKPQRTTNCNSANIIYHFVCKFDGDGRNEK